MTADSTKPPEMTKGDIAHALTKAGISAIPLAGGPAAELFQLVIQPPLERRRKEWMETVGEKLKELEQNGLDLEALSDNQEFISAVMHASQIALRTHQDEKLEALKNAVTNIAVGQSPDEALQHMFFEWVDSFSALHLRILKLFQSPTPPPGMSMGGLSSVLEHNIPELRAHSHLYIQIWRDLYSRGLVNTERMNLTMSGSGLSQKQTTEIGDAFLKFIAEPMRAL